MKPAAILTIATLLALTAGCGGGGKSATSPTSSTSRSTGEAVLRRAVRATLDENHRLSVYVLWSDKAPASAERSTRGPALTGLRAAAAKRRNRGIRVRLLRDQFQILSIQLDPSYTRAIAIARGRQRVRPYRLNGTPAGRAVNLDEKARIELRRVGQTNRFIVWRVSLLG